MCCVIEKSTCVFKNDIARVKTFFCGKFAKIFFNHAKYFSLLYSLLTNLLNRIPALACIHSQIGLKTVESDQLAFQNLAGQFYLAFKTGYIMDIP